jgi:4-hydroxy-tetrahydrodipicolinate synthase
MKQLKILSEHQNIIGLKEANPDQFKMIRLGALSNDNFTILSGDDYTVVPSMSAGAKGVISVVANIMPRLFSSMTEAMLNNQYESALKIQSDLLEIIDAMFIESNPVPVKTALFNMKMISNEFRLPLVEMSQKNKVKLKNIMMKFGLIEKMFKE